MIKYFVSTGRAATIVALDLENAAVCESLSQSAERQAAQLGHAHPRKTREKPHVLPKALQNPVHLVRASAAIGDPVDPDLQRVIEAWPTLPEAIRRAMLALVEAARANAAR